MSAIMPAELAVRKREEANDRAERDYADSLPYRLSDALLKIEDPENLRRIVEDEELCGPLANLMEVFDQCATERQVLDPKLKLTPALGVALRAMAEIQRTLCKWEIGE